MEQVKQALQTTCLTLKKCLHCSSEGNSRASLFIYFHHLRSNTHSRRQIFLISNSKFSIFFWFPVSFTWFSAAGGGWIQKCQWEKGWEVPKLEKAQSMTLGNSSELSGLLQRQFFPEPTPVGENVRPKLGSGVSPDGMRSRRKTVFYSHSHQPGGSEPLNNLPSKFIDFFTTSLPNCWGAFSAFPKIL